MSLDDFERKELEELKQTVSRLDAAETRHATQLGRVEDKIGICAESLAGIRDRVASIENLVRAGDNSHRESKILLEAAIKSLTSQDVAIKELYAAVRSMQRRPRRRTRG